MLKAMRLFIPIDMLVYPCFKITASFANAARTRNISSYIVGKISIHWELDLHKKVSFNFEWVKN